MESLGFSVRSCYLQTETVLLLLFYVDDFSLFFLPNRLRPFEAYSWSQNTVIPAPASFFLFLFLFLSSSDSKGEKNRLPLMGGY